MAIVTLHQAKTHLSRIARAAAGDEIVIAPGREPVARLSPIGPARRKLVLGMLAGEVAPLPDSFFFAPLPDDEQRAWDGTPNDPAL